MKKDSRLLAENGGPVTLTKDWAHYYGICEKPTVK